MSTYMYLDQMPQLYAAGTQQVTYLPPPIHVLKYYMSDVPGVPGGHIGPMEKPPQLSTTPTTVATSVSQVGGCCDACKKTPAPLGLQVGAGSGIKLHKPIIAQASW